jgi:hypothetical protein
MKSKPPHPHSLKSKKERKADDGTVISAVLANNTQRKTAQFGGAIHEHLSSYQELKTISTRKINPSFSRQNIKQQAGFVAEIKQVARKNAENHLRKTGKKIIRTDNIGRLNDPLVDLLVVTGKGKILENSKTQMKFVGKTPKAAFQSLTKKKFQKYLDNGVKLSVPSDFYDGIKEEAKKNINGLKTEISRLKKTGNSTVLDGKLKELEKSKKIKTSLRKSLVSNADAIEGRLHPKLSVCKDVTKLAHQAGLEQAKAGAALGGGISIVKNFIAVLQKEKTKKEALSSVVKDVACSAGAAYTVGALEASIKGTMQGASSSISRSIAKTNFPATIALMALESGKTLRRFFSGKIDGPQCLEELGEKGTGMVSSAMFAAIGQIAIPVPILGAAVGSMLGFALSSAFYKELTSALHDGKIARRERIRIEAECEESVRMIKEYRKTLEDTMSAHFQECHSFFQNSLDIFQDALFSNNINLFISNSANIIQELGGIPQFTNSAEFEKLMRGHEPITL